MSDRCSGFEARHASRKLKLLTVNISKATGGALGEQQAAESVVTSQEFLFLILPFSETATDPTTTKSTRTLESKPTGVL